MKKLILLSLFVVCFVTVIGSVNVEGVVEVHDYFYDSSLCQLDEYGTSLGGMGINLVNPAEVGFYLYDPATDIVGCVPFSYSQENPVVPFGEAWHVDPRPYYSGTVEAYRLADVETDVDTLCYTPLELQIEENQYFDDFDADGIVDEIYYMTDYYINEDNVGLFSSEGVCVQSGRYTAKIKHGTWQVVESHAGASIEGLTCWDDVQARIHGHIWQNNGSSQNGECNYCTVGGYERAELIQKCANGGYCAYKQEDTTDSADFYEWIKCFPQSSTIYIDDRTCHIDWASSTSYYQQYYGFSSNAISGYGKWSCNYPNYYTFMSSIINVNPGGKPLNCFLPLVPSPSEETLIVDGITYANFSRRINTRTAFDGNNLMCSTNFSLIGGS